MELLQKKENGVETMDMDKQEVNHTENYHQFRCRYPEFIYHGYDLAETGEYVMVTYHFQIPGLSEFAPEWHFPKPKERKARGISASLLDQMVFSLGMVELVSYWKITCSPKVVIKGGTLDQQQVEWWKDLYYNGLGEFFYVNGISEAGPEDFMEILAEAPKKRVPEEKGILPKEECDWPSVDVGTGVLVPIGGGKDSAVTLELLKEAGADCFGYIINPRGASVHTAEAAGLAQDKVIQVKRTLDPNMLALNRQGYLNGHTPFSAIVAFSSLIAAALYGLPYIALSNESSANESTIQGSTVNHQYSKSFRFEKDFHEYAKTYLPGSSYYFSMLRPLSEFQIAACFAGFKEYHQIFRSCNVGSKKDEWCGHCPKCLFVYLILSPFLETEEVEEIFGKNMLEDETMLGTMEKLVGIQEEKPFECVGSRGEVNTAIMLTIRRLEEENKPLPRLLKAYQDSAFYKQYSRLGDGYSDFFDEENLVPKPWKKLVRNRCVRNRRTM